MFQLDERLRLLKSETNEIDHGGPSSSPAKQQHPHLLGHVGEQEWRRRRGKYGPKKQRKGKYGESKYHHRSV